jgi:hypothetical protein
MVELPPLMLVNPPNPALLFPPLIVTGPPAMLDKVDPAEIPTEPPMLSALEEELPTDKIMSPPWPLLPPPGPDVNDILPETPDVEAPVDIISCPETPETPASGVLNEKRPELVASLLPLEIRNSPPYPAMLPPADKKLLPPLTVPIPDIMDIVPPSPCTDDPELIKTDPPLELKEPPVAFPATIFINPPSTLLLVEPADRATEPPSPEYPEPTENEIDPALPAAAIPDEKLRIPELPMVVLPVAILTSPL